MNWYFCTGEDWWQLPVNLVLLFINVCLVVIALRTLRAAERSARAALMAVEDGRKQYALSIRPKLCVSRERVEQQGGYRCLPLLRNLGRGFAYHVAWKLTAHSDGQTLLVEGDLPGLTPLAPHKLMISELPNLRLHGCVTCCDIEGNRYWLHKGDRCSDNWRAGEGECPSCRSTLDGKTTA